MDGGYSHIWHASPVRGEFWGWVDRFAAPAHIHRQRERASKNRLRSIYTPQVVRNGRDWLQWSDTESRISVSPETARVHITTVLLWYETFSEFISAAKYR